MLVTIAIVAAAITAYALSCRNKPFDGEAWRSGRGRAIMVDDLIPRLTDEDWSQGRILTELGRTEQSEQAKTWTYPIGPRPCDPLGVPYYLRIRFDDRGEVIVARAIPQ